MKNIRISKQGFKAIKRAVKAAKHFGGETDINGLIASIVAVYYEGYQTALTDDVLDLCRAFGLVDE